MALVALAAAPGQAASTGGGDIRQPHDRLQRR